MTFHVSHAIRQISRFARFLVRLVRFLLAARLSVGAYLGKMLGRDSAITRSEGERIATFQGVRPVLDVSFWISH